MPATTSKPTTSAFALFETAVGTCGIAWAGEKVVGTALPEDSDAKLRRRMLARWPGSVEADPPEPIRAAIEAVTALLAGEPADLSFIALDMARLSAFEQQVYAAAFAIPVGETRTYGELAAAIGEPGAARAVGVALGRNPFPIIIPCHRILAAGGKSGGFSAPGGTDTKFRILRIERAGADTGGLFDDLPLAVRPDPRR